MQFAMHENLIPSYLVWNNCEALLCFKIYVCSNKKISSFRMTDLPGVSACMLESFQIRRFTAEWGNARAVYFSSSEVFLSHRPVTTTSCGQPRTLALPYILNGFFPVFHHTYTQTTCSLPGMSVYMQQTCFCLA